ncbi:MAG TPA: UvrD-helicase domain-containing protein [Anaerolineae bacterium]|nr:UvrD-helicase domain-containing protein [Anaerolineae bacterium]HQH37415.1 UvrD-helicase domain-containing protein [Anaerolineae bacterium]
MNERTHSILQTLNPQQQAAITTPNGPVLVLAGPGSGKTRVLTHRIAWMLAEMRVPAWQILAVTFTNKAAREMRHRLDTMLGDASTQAMTLGTFHAACARILRREAGAAGLSPNYLIFDADDQLTVMKQVIKDLGLDDKRYKPHALLNAISGAKNELIPPADYPVQTYYDEIVARAYARYQDTLRQNNSLDFDDLLMETARLLRNDPGVRDKYRGRYRYLLVDEFQDTNMAQYVILHLLAQEHHSLYVVADEDQSIYSWRGADYRNIQRLRTDFPELRQFLLEENYRSTQVILDGAQAIISSNLDRTPKHLFTHRRGGDPITLHEAYDEQEEADFVAGEIKTLTRSGYAYSDIAVMYRTNAQSRALEEACVRHNIPYRLIGATRFYARKEIKDVLAYLRLAQTPDDDVSFMRVVNVPPRGLGTRTLDALAEAATARGGSRYQGALSLLEQGTLTNRALQSLKGFIGWVNRWQQLRTAVSVTQLLDAILADIGYESYVRDGSDDGESRWENIQALRAVVADAPEITLADFLTEVALVADIDELAEEVRAVTLLTLHSAKGLEYPVVFLTGLEEGMLPHSRSMDSPQQIAEERRLLYVGMTRAEKRLYLTYAFRRGWGQYNKGEPAAPSRFLTDLPDEVLDHPRRKQKNTAPRQWAVAWSDDSPSRPAPSTPQLQYRQGQRVRHTHYGEGMVLESQMEGRSEMVTVLFTNGIGVKHLLAGMAPLEPISEH